MDIHIYSAEKRGCFRTKFHTSLSLLSQGKTGSWRVLRAQRLWQDNVSNVVSSSDGSKGGGAEEKDRFHLLASFRPMQTVKLAAVLSLSRHLLPNTLSVSRG